MKKVIFWETCKFPIGNKTVGKFKTKVNPEVNGAVHFKGENPSTKVSWDYHALVRDSITGKVRWVDKVEDKYSGAALVLYLESEKFLHKLKLNYDASPCRDIMNRLLSISGDITERNITLTYWVRPKTGLDGTVKLNDKNQPILQDNIIIKDVEPMFKDWRKYSEDNGLEWKQSKDAKGKVSYDMSNELKFWDEKISEIQLILLRKKVALPFSYGSFICSETPNPSGAKNLPENALAYAKTRYEEIRGNYQMPFSKKEQDADDIDDFSYTPAAKVTVSQPVVNDVNDNFDFVKEDVVINIPEVVTGNFDDLPF